MMITLVKEWVKEKIVNISIELPSDLENELSAEASQLKLPLSEYIIRVLSFRPFLQNPPKTGLDI